MLGIHHGYSEAGAVSYQSQNLAKEGYYLDKEVKAYWMGDVARRLGYEGKEVTKVDFRAFVSGKIPETNKKLHVRERENRRVGYDVTLSVSKSVSVVYAMTKDPQILEAFRTAYKETFKEIEAHSQIQANTRYGRFYESSASLLAAPFVHHTSRPCEVKKDGKTLYVSDPQLHVHLYCPSVSWSTDRQKFMAVELGNVRRQAKYFENAFHSTLAYELEKCGYSTRLTKDRFELDVSRELLERFSNRSKIIDQVAHEKGILDNKRKADLGALTRHSKAKTISEKELYQHWKDRLSQDEFDALFKLKGKPSPPKEAINPKLAIERSIQHHCERNSAFKQSDVLAYALQISYGSLRPQDVKKALNERTDIVRAEFETVPYITTHKMIAEEDKLIQMAVDGKGKFPKINPNFQVKDKLLNEQQKTAIQEILHSHDFVTALHGSAGTGKSTMLKIVNNAIEQSGRQLHSIGPSSQSVSALKEKGMEAQTIASFLKNSRAHENLYGQYILVDEAGMCGLKTCNEILSLAKEKKARVIMCGDTSQHAPPAQYGDGMRILRDKAQVKTVTVNKIVRQKENQQLRATVELLAKNKTLQGFKKLEKMGAVIEAPEKDQRLSAIGDAYMDSIKAKRSALVVSPTHAEGDQINALIRHKMKRAGLLKGKEREFTTYKSLSFTDDQKKNLTNYEPGNVLKFINNVKGYRAGTHYEVVAGNKPDDLKVRDIKTKQIFKFPASHHDKFQVFQQKKIPLAKGERIRLTQNTKTVEGNKTNNGTVHEIKSFSPSGDLVLANGKTLSKETGHFRYSYCETSHSSQGKDADNVIVSVSDLSFTTASREQFYVSVSRGKKSAKVVTSDISELRKAIGRTEQRISGREVLEAQQGKQLVRQQRNHHRSINEKIREHGSKRERENNPSRHISFKSPNTRTRE
ncbi:MobF family relaxase [Marinoscillum sp.]|uniref:MobF family relaxase n=1 Tax=Marinoscillum sp. TaxID=2024838 RepID=UPI003BA88627